MNQQINALRARFQAELAAVSDLTGLDRLRVQFFGKKGELPKLMVELRNVSPEDRPILGKAINDLKDSLSSVCDQLQSTLEKAEMAKRLSSETLDLSLPGRNRYRGKRHPIGAFLHRLIEVGSSMGFSVQYGPDIDSDYYNYEGLNFPPDHPARDMQDTFYISSDLLLRSHTSNTQLRVMETHEPPIRIIAPGTVFRNEEISSRSHVFFHQVEGLYIDRGVTLADLFSTIETLCRRLFERPVEMRFRPSFFPFVEPGVEVDIACTQCEGKGCRLCKETGWLEVLGAGMVHPEVLKNGGIDPEIFSGYAWGMGVERLAMLRSGVNDIRLFADNDLRFLTQV